MLLMPIRESYKLQPSSLDPRVFAPAGRVSSCWFVQAGECWGELREREGEEPEYSNGSFWELPNL